MPAMTVKHYNGTALAAAPAQVSFAHLAQYIGIACLDSTHDLKVSFDQGRTFFTVLHATTFQFHCCNYNVWVQGSGGDVAYCIITNEG